MADKEPKSVAVMNKHPYLFGKYRLGTVFFNMLCAIRNMYDIVTERQRFQLLANPLLKQNTGGAGNTRFEIAATVYAILGAVYTKALTQDVSVSSSANTTAGQYRAVTVSLNANGDIAQTVSAVATAQPVTPPAPPTTDCPIATIQIPASFTAGTTVFSNAWVTNGWSAQQSFWAVKPVQLPDTDM